MSKKINININGSVQEQPDKAINNETTTNAWEYDFSNAKTPDPKMFGGKQNAGKVLKVDENGFITPADVGSGEPENYLKYAWIADNNITFVDNHDLEYSYSPSFVTLDQVKSITDPIESDVNDIQSLIPSEASSTNQLADKNFVNVSIETSTATFRGSFQTKALLDAYSGDVDNNDYAVVLTDETHDNETWRYKFNAAGEWLAEYKISNSPLTPSQIAALNSGITDDKVTDYDNHINDTDNPHHVSKSQVGLGNVDNTSDLDKPISTQMQTALDGKEDSLYVINCNYTGGVLTVADVTAIRTRKNVICRLIDDTFHDDVIISYVEGSSIAEGRLCFYDGEDLYNLNITLSLTNSTYHVKEEYIELGANIPLYKHTVIANYDLDEYSAKRIVCTLINTDSTAYTSWSDVYDAMSNGERLQANGIIRTVSPSMAAYKAIITDIEKDDNQTAPLNFVAHYIKVDEANWGALQTYSLSLNETITDNVKQINIGE